ncbi:MAG: DoxX family protein [Hydrotalea sp.]|nr:DoxX family protein [Hydrotalea sp.]
MKIKTALNWVLKLTVAIILLQTLYFKFLAHPDSVYIFSELGVEPWGRIGLGIAELITAILIFIPKTELIGMINSLLIIIGAIGAHIFVIGIDIKNDHGGLFTLALIVLVCSVTYLFLNKNKVNEQLLSKRFASV